VQKALILTEGESMGIDNRANNVAPTFSGNGYHLKPTRPLEPRAREAWGLLAQGLSNQEIAERMRIRCKVVENYVNDIYQSLGLGGISNSRRVKAALLCQKEEERLSFADNRRYNFPPTFAALQEMWQEREAGYREERERLLELLREAYVVLVSPPYLESFEGAARAVAARIARVLDGC
jgi:DNA-binding CsgD family transcriptional regulator